MTIRIRLFLAALACIATTSAHATRPDRKTLPIGLAPFERPLAPGLVRAMTLPPEGHVRSLAEWEAAEAVMTLWTNPSYVRALVAHGPVKLLADGESERGWWQEWLTENGIPQDKVSYFVVATDSIWVRDYGPWFILDGAGRFGIVDSKYNRPRPKDDEVPVWMAQELGLPYFHTGLVHTGGNYYNDGQDNAYSSTLVFRENTSLSQNAVRERMQSYLGIERYGTSPLAPGITIEHLDTFGKLVAPDTWVFSDFPQGSRFRADSEKYVKMLQGLKSPYGTPFRILRLKMRPTPGGGSESFRAYLNSFISNRALFFPSYGDAIDDEVKAIYQDALPGYDIVPVDNGETEWGDSVHCRSRNLLKRDTVFLFPTVEPKTRTVTVEAYPAAGRRLAGDPQLCWEVNGGGSQCRAMLATGKEREFRLAVPASRGDQVALYVEAVDDAGAKKTAPPAAPQQLIRFTAEE